MSLGTVTNVDEAVRWLSYTYLHVRMRKNPLVYGVAHAELRDDPELDGKRRAVVIDAARRLDKVFTIQIENTPFSTIFETIILFSQAKMIRFEERTGFLYSTDLGRTASHFYVKSDSVDVFNEHMKPYMNEADILAMLCL